MKKFKAVAVEILSDNGKLSFSRIATAAWITASITWVSCYFCATRMLPDGGQLGGIASVCGALYGANKIGNCLGGFFAGGADNGGNDNDAPRSSANRKGQ